jgi:hypothetical protein
MAIKAINNIIRLNKLVLILFIFGLYLRIISWNPLALTITKRAKAICVAIKEV